MKTYLSIKNVVLIVMGLLLNTSMFAQSSGIILGSIKNEESGNGMPGVLVSIVDINKSVESDNSGNFTLAGVTPGEYTVEISHKGYSKKILTEVEVEGGKVLNLHSSLRKSTTNSQVITTSLKELKENEKNIDSLSKTMKGIGVWGKVIDIDNMNPIAGVSISVENTDFVTTTDENGEFMIALPRKGNYNLVSTYLGYQKEITPAVVDQDSWEYVNVALVSENSQLDEIVITRRRSQVSELAILEERKISNLFVEKIGAQELSRKGVDDASSAVSKLSGVSKQEGSTQVYVRGLGDRYISTSLNGLPVPSSDPTLKNIALDIFSTDIIDYLGVDKAYNSNINGDFGGASVNIGSKDFRGDRLFEVSVGSSVNSNAISNRDEFFLQQGPNFWGYSNYSTPSDAQGSYHFKNSWDPIKKSYTPMNFGVKLGDSFTVGEQGRISLFATAKYSNSFTSRSGVNSNYSAQGAPLKSLHQDRNSFGTNSTGMFNANYQINPNHKIGYNFVYINSSNQSNDLFNGFIRDAGNDAEDGRGFINRKTFDNTQLIINQLTGQHALSSKVDLNWGLGYNLVDGNMPDRMQAMYSQTTDGDYHFIRINSADNHRYSYFLKENEFAANISAAYKFGEDDKGKLTVGYSGKMKERTFDVMQLNFNIKNGLQESTLIDPLHLDEYLGASGFGSFYDLVGMAGNAFQYYNGDQDIHAGFATVDYKFNDKLSAVLGLRYEHIKQFVEFNSIEYRPGNNTLKKNGLLPSLNLKYTLNQKNNLRLAVSKTYTLPQFKERVRFPYEEVTQVTVGNPYLYASDNYNFDLKWEMFPSDGELFSVTGFGKYIQNPINEIMVSSASNDISFANTGDKGFVYGVELEAKKNIIDWDNNKLSVGFNAAIMKTDQKFDAEKVSNETEGLLNIDPTHASSKFTGASDFIVNADLSYNRTFSANKDLTATVLYNYYSDKLYAIGTGGLGNRVDKGVGSLDFVLKSQITKSLGINFSALNILNPEVQRWQENVEAVKVLSYKRGAFFNLGVNYKF